MNYSEHISTAAKKTIIYLTLQLTCAISSTSLQRNKYLRREGEEWKGRERERWRKGRSKKSGRERMRREGGRN